MADLIYGQRRLKDLEKNIFLLLLSKITTFKKIITSIKIFASTSVDLHVDRDSRGNYLQSG